MQVDIPGGRATCRVSIVAGAGSASDAALTGPGGAGGSNIDRVVGFAGVYPDNRVPYGPVLQVRRDNAYRRLGASLRGPVKVAWHCAYYITKATPVEPTPHAKNATNGSPNSYRHVSNGKSAQGSPDYDQILDLIGIRKNRWGCDPFEVLKLKARTFVVAVFQISYHYSL